MDAPTVAALWTWFIASANHIHLPFSSTLSMALAVWMLYAADRLMDARPLDSNATRQKGLEARHYFHHRHRTAVLAGIVLSSLTLAALLPHLDAAALRLYLILGGMVAGYFILIHATHSSSAQQKEVPIVCRRRSPWDSALQLRRLSPTVARRPDLRLPLLPTALAFATLCSLNCLFIYAWEHEDQRINVPPHTITRLALDNLLSLTVALISCSIALVLLDHRVPWPVPCASALSAAVLLLLHNRRHAVSQTTLRAAADLALTTPILLLPWLRR